MKNIVAKFGGTSMATEEAIGRVISIILSLAGCQLVVVSAPGRRSSADTKMTDLLFAGRISEVVARFRALARAFGVELDLSELEQMRGEQSEAFLASRGEYYSSQLLAKILGWEWIDAADVMRFHNDGRFDAETSYRLIREATVGRKCVIGGYYGRTHDGRIVTFERGGSDITGAHCAIAVGADEYHNYTDVCGVYDANPATNPGARQMPEVCAEYFLTELGAPPVVNQHAVIAASAAGLVTIVANTFDPDGGRTRIVPCVEHQRIAA